jgi:hypothetical protein
MIQYGVTNFLKTRNNPSTQRPSYTLTTKASNRNDDNPHETMSSPSTSERIPITHYSACSGSYNINRTNLPPFVNHKEFRGGAVTELEWQEFTHLIDAQLRPINKLRNVLRGLLVITATVLLAFVIFIFFGYDQPTLEYFEDYRNYWLMPTFAGLLAVAGAALSCYIAIVTNESFMAIQRICEAQSKVLSMTTRANQSLLVSFHLCDERSTKGFDVQCHDMVYTGTEYYHQPFRTYHNVYILAVVTMVDPENPFAPSEGFGMPIKFPTIEFDSATDDDNSTLGESTIYTSMTGGGMSVTRDVLKSIEKKKKIQQRAKAAPTTLEIPKSNETHTSKVADNKPTKKPKKSKKKTNAQMSTTSKSTKRTYKESSGKGKKGRPKSQTVKLDTITESS